MTTANNENAMNNEQNTVTSASAVSDVSSMPSPELDASETFSEEPALSRYDISGVTPHFYPTSKAGHTSKERRYCPKTKHSDVGKTHGKKGKSYKKLKHEGLPPTLTDN